MVGWAGWGKEGRGWECMRGAWRLDFVVLIFGS